MLHVDLLFYMLYMNLLVYMLYNAFNILYVACKFIMLCFTYGLFNYASYLDPLFWDNFYTKFILIYYMVVDVLLSKRHFSVVYFKQGAYVRELVLSQ